MTATTIRFGLDKRSPEHAARIANRSHQLWVTLIWLLGALLVLQGLRSGFAGGITSSDLAAARSSTGNPLANSAYQAVRLAIVAVSVLAVLYAGPLSFTRSAASRIFRVGVFALVASFAASAIWGTKGATLGIELLEMPLLLAAFAALPAPDFQRLVQSIQKLLVVIGAASLLYYLVAPQAASQPYYGGLVDALPVRLHGITPHANILGAAMGIYLILDLTTKSTGAKVWAARGVVVVALLLSQSKTTIGVLLVAYLVCTVAAGRHAKKGRLLRFVVSVAGVVVGLRLASSELTGSFTGRDVIWAATEEVWLRNVLFGYGPGLWDLTMRSEYIRALPNPPAHAHSQVWQTLGAFGLLGAFALGVVILALIVAAASARRSTGYASVGLVIFLVGRSFSEPVLFMESTTSSVVALIAIAALLAASKGSQKGS